MHWGSFTSAIVQLIAGHPLVCKYLTSVDNAALGIDQVELNKAKLLIVFTEFKDWNKNGAEEGWGQLCKHLNELPWPYNANIGVVKTDFEKGIYFPPKKEIF